MYLCILLFRQNPRFFSNNFLLVCYSMLRNSTHETFAEKLYQKFKDNPHFSKPKFSRSDFTIHHYAGNVGNMFLMYF
jgi:hypothetical protein